MHSGRVWIVISVILWSLTYWICDISCRRCPSSHFKWVFFCGWICWDIIYFTRICFSRTLYDHENTRKTRSEIYIYDLLLNGFSVSRPCFDRLTGSFGSEKISIFIHPEHTLRRCLTIVLYTYLSLYRLVYFHACLTEIDTKKLDCFRLNSELRIKTIHLTNTNGRHTTHTERRWWRRYLPHLLRFSTSSRKYHSTPQLPS